MMPQTVAIRVQMPADLAEFRLPPGVNARLQELLDKQDSGRRLTVAERSVAERSEAERSEAERSEAEGLVNLAEFLTLLRLRTERLGKAGAKQR